MRSPTRLLTPVPVLRAVLPLVARLSRAVSGALTGPLGVEVVKAVVGALVTVGLAAWIAATVVTRQLEHTHLQWSGITLKDSCWRSHQFCANDTVKVGNTVTNVKGTVPAQHVVVRGGVTITPLAEIEQAYARRENVESIAAMGTLFNESAFMSYPSRPWVLSSEDADRLNGGHYVVCLVAYARWNDEAGRWETKHSVCYTPNRSGQLRWMPNSQNNEETRLK
jgi:hypothetical protein